MDYEKKYKETIEKLRDFYRDYDTVSCLIDVKEELANLFPELKESEDERIRKWLIELVEEIRKANPTNADHNGMCSEAVAWLEKQGEPMNINPSEFDLRLNKLLKQFETLPKEELASSLSFYLNVVQNNGTYKHEEKQGEQKPDKIQLGKKYKCIASPRYSTFMVGKTYKPEDKFLCSFMNFCSDCFVSIEDNGQKDPCETCEEPRLNCQNFPCERKKNFESANKGIREPKFKVKVNPTWSEEDERIYKSITYSFAHNYPLTVQQQEFVKSIRPQNHWKPTEEQMEALHDLNLTGYISYAGQGQVLIELYNDLKKLTE